MLDVTPFGIFFIGIVILCLFLGRFALIVCILLGSAVLTTSVFELSGGGPIYAGVFAGVVFFVTYLSPTWNYYKNIKSFKDVGWTGIIFFCFFAILSSFVLPFIFENSIFVSNAHDIKNDIFWATPLQFSATNISQSAYLVINFLSALSIAAYFNAFPHDFFRIIRVMYKMNWLILGLAAWEFLSFYLILPFPFDFFGSNNNIRYAINLGIFSSVRVSTTFGEPSQFAPYLVGMILMCLVSTEVFLNKIERKALLISNWCAVIASTSSTAFVAAVIILLFYSLFFQKAKISKKIKYILISICVLSACLLGLIVFLASHFSDVLVYYQDVIFSKLTNFNDRSSASERMFRDLTALGAMADSYGLGVGWGSTRASSLVAHILGNVGGWGAFFFSYFIYKFWRNGRNNTHATPLISFYIGALITASLSVADFLTYELYWVIIAAVLGFITSDVKNHNQTISVSTT